MMKTVLLCCLVVAVAAGPPVTKSRAEVEKYKSALEKTREGDGLTLEERMKQNPLANPWENSGRYQGDMILDEEVIDALTKAFATDRSAYIVANSKWPSNTVIYEFAAGHFNNAQQNYILLIMDFLSEHSCVRFRRRTASDRAYVSITGNSDGCYAHVGYSASRGVHTYNVARDNPSRGDQRYYFGNPDGCYAHVGYSASRGVHIYNVARDTPGRGCLNGVVIAHEWLHILGFFHMHSTYNRYDYVRIHWENIQNGYAHAFDRYANNMVSNLGLPYEYRSCMHYTSHAFSSNGRATISTTRPYDGVLGNYDYVTGYDFLRLNRHYNCPGAWSAEAKEQARITKYMVHADGTVAEEISEEAQ